ncbi:hypothetical protein [uncultured Sulfitobacter sp.]|uniref:hypothetical protein n=1 Tax=uncultured Sulfitobacter sp. TaxID=191468 RepID=UPI002624457F|nr:hypothetical protein [uncultured Sulfitobacter sp.]
MRILSFTFRLAAVVALIAYQVYLAYEYGVEGGFASFYIYQCGLHLAATVIAPPYTRRYVSVAAGWASAVMACAVVVSWVTFVIPVISLIGIFVHGDFTVAMYLVGATIYLAIPAGIFLFGYFLDDLEL